MSRMNFIFCLFLITSEPGKNTILEDMKSYYCEKKCLFVCLFVCLGLYNFSVILGRLTGFSQYQAMGIKCLAQ